MAGELILVVDDGRENREFVVNYVLKPNGYRAIVAKDGEEGLRKALTESPDLILLDLQMPKLNGIQVLEELQRRNVNIPVILMTFYGSEEIAIKVFRMGVRDYVSKPFTDEEMLEAIERALTETRLRREKEALTERLLQSNLELQKRLKELNALYSIGKSVTSLLDIDKLLVRVVDAATYVTGADECSLMLIQNGELWRKAVKRPNEDKAHTVNTKVSERLAYRAVHTAQPVTLSTASAMGDSNLRCLPKSVLYTPLKLGNKVIGVLGVGSLSGDKPFTDHDAALLNALADYAAIAISNARLFAALEEAKEREKQRIRQAFERYVAPSVVDQVLGSPDAMSLGGRRREISILFADIRGYTTFSENTPPERVVEVLNEYFSLAAEVILERGGTLDKFMGDSVMAFFNAPEPQENHPYLAVEAAIEIQRVIARRNSRPDREYRLMFGIGISLGEAVVGNIGTLQHMNYTAIGDTVNLARRLQEKAGPGQILVDESVVRRLGDLIRVEPLGLMELKGRHRRANVYELKGLAKHHKVKTASRSGDADPD